MSFGNFLKSAITNLDDVVSPATIEQLKAIATLKDAWPKLKTLGQWSDPLEFLLALKDFLANPDATATLKSVGLEDIHEHLKRLSAILSDEIPSELQLLLAPLNALSANTVDVVRWARDGSFSTNALGTATARGKVSIEAEADARWFYSSDIEAPEGLLRIGLFGEFDGGGSGQIPFSTFGRLTASASGKLAFNLHLFWKRSGEKSFARALLDCLSQPFDILSLPSAWQASQSSVGFAGAVLTLNGTTQLATELALSRDVKIEDLFDARAGLTASVDLLRSGAYELSVLALDSGLRMRLSHDEKDARNWAVEAGLADIQVSALAPRVEAIVAEATTEWDSALQKIKPYLTPGAWVREQMAQEVESLLERISNAAGGDGKAAIAALETDVLLVLVRQDQASSAVGDYLEAQIAGAVAATGGSLQKASTQYATEVMGALTLPTMLETKIAQALQAEVDRLIQQFQQSFEKTAKDLSVSLGGALDSGLSKLAIRSAGSASAVDRHLTGLRTLVEQTDARVHRLLEATTKVAKAKIAARLRFENQRLEYEQFDFSGTFTPSGTSPAFSSGAQDLYRSVWFGKLSSAARQFGPQATPITGFRPDAMRSSIRRFSTVNRNLGYEIIFLSFDITGKSTVSGEADVTLSGDGRAVVNSKALALREASGLFETRSARFISSYALLIARAEGLGRDSSLQRSMGLGLSTDRGDKDLTVTEASNFLRRLVTTGLIRPSRVDSLEAYLSGLAATRGQANKLGGTLRVDMSLDTRDMERLTALGKEFAADPDTSLTSAARTAVSTAIDALIMTEEWEADHFLYFVEMCMGKRKGFSGQKSEQITQAKEKFFNTRWLKTSNPMPIQPKGGGTVTDSRVLKGRARLEAVLGLNRILATLWRMQNANPVNTPLKPNDWGVTEYRNADVQIAREALHWVGNSQEVPFLFKKGIDQSAVALMRTFAELARGPDLPVENYDNLFDVSVQTNNGGIQIF